MNKERYNQIIDEVYEDWILESCNGRIYPDQNNKEEFTNRITTDSEFSDKWGLKIEERELSFEEKHRIYVQRCLSSGDGLSGCAGPDGPCYEFYEKLFEKYNVPTSVIVVTYKEEKIEIYE